MEQGLSDEEERAMPEVAELEVWIRRGNEFSFFSSFFVFSSSQVRVETKRVEVETKRVKSVAGLVVGALSEPSIGSLPRVSVRLLGGESVRRRLDR